MKQLTIRYTNPDTNQQYSQTFDLSEKDIVKVFSQLASYRGGEIPENSPLFYLFTSITYLSKLQGFKRTPNFEMDPPDDIEDLAQIFRS